MTETAIRRVKPQDWEILRDLRLRALETDPRSFGSTLEREKEYADERWQKWAQDDAASAEEATFLAICNGRTSGLVAAYRDEHAPELYHVVSMWVTPDARGRGLGPLLLRTIEEWIASAGGSVVQLYVTNEAESARRLYSAAGYEPDGEVEQSPHTGDLLNISLRKTLSR